MPNRMLRDWTDSEPVNSLSWQAECFFVRLIMKADDFGRFHGNAKLLKSLLFPLKDGLRDADISRWIAECETAGILRVYQNGGKPFVEIVNFGQRLRSSQSRFPAPDSSDDSDSPSSDRNPPSHDRNCPPESETETRGERREIQNETSESNDSFVSFSPEPENSGNPGRRKTLKKRVEIFFDYEGDSRIHGITPEQLELWKSNFPALDVEQELRTASAWLDGNRKQRKSDVKRFLTNWLSRAQDRAKLPVQAPSPATSREEQYQRKLRNLEERTAEYRKLMEGNN